MKAIRYDTGRRRRREERGRHVREHNVRRRRGRGRVWPIPARDEQTLGDGEGRRGFVFGAVKRARRRKRSRKRRRGQ